MRVQCGAPRHRVSKRRKDLAIALALLAIAGAAWPASAGSDLFDDLYSRGHALNGDLRTFTADFTEATTSPLLARPLVARGTVAVERPFRLALRYVEPEERLILIDGDRMIVSWPLRGLRQIKDIAASRKRIDKYFVKGSPDDLRGHFAIAAREVDDDRGDYLVTMTPKRRRIQEGLARLELWIDRSTLLMSAMRMTFPNGQEKLLTFTNVEPNAPIDPTTFREPGRPGDPK